jgi:hypothetical protein
MTCHSTKKIDACTQNEINNALAIERGPLELGAEPTQQCNCSLMRLPMGTSFAVSSIEVEIICKKSELPALGQDSTADNAGE